MITKIPPWGGDHGTETPAAMAGTMLMPLPDPNPNRIAQRRRVNIIDKMSTLTLRQRQAAKAIQDAHEAIESLSSGSELKERVDASPKPDAFIAAQCQAMERLAHVMKPVRRSQRDIVEHVCWYNQPINSIKGQHRVRAASRLRGELNLIYFHLWG